MPASASRRGSPSSQMPSSAHLPEYPPYLSFAHALWSPRHPLSHQLQVNQRSRATGSDIGPELGWGQFTLSCGSHGVSGRLWPLYLGSAVGQWGPQWEEKPGVMGRTWLWTQISCHPRRAPSLRPDESGELQGEPAPCSCFHIWSGSWASQLCPFCQGEPRIRVPPVLYHVSPDILIP